MQALSACPSSMVLCLRPSSIRGRARRRARSARSYRPHVPTRTASGPGRRFHRPDLHGGRGDGLRHGLDTADRCSCQSGCVAAPSLAAIPATLGMGRYRALHHRRLRGARPWPCSYVLSRTRFGSRLRASVDDWPGGGRPGHQRQCRVPAHLRRRLGSGRPGRRAGRRGDGAGPALPAQDT
jgi:hypothetical protein